MASETHRRHRDRVDGEFHRQHHRSFRAGLDDRGRSPRARGDETRPFLHQAECHQFRDEVGHRGPVESRHHRQLGAGDRTLEVELFEDDGEVVTPHLLGGDAPAPAV